jgi:hypothetical protein
MKAPSATEYPNDKASSAAAKQMPMLADRSRHDQEADAYEASEECREPGPGHRETRGRHRSAGRDRGENRDEEDPDQVFDDENAEDDLGESPLHALLLERLRDDRRARDRDDGAGEHALERRPAEELAKHVTDPDHPAALGDGNEPRRRADPEQLAEAELEP